MDECTPDEHTPLATARVPSMLPPSVGSSVPTRSRGGARGLHVVLRLQRPAVRGRAGEDREEDRTVLERPAEPRDRRPSKPAGAVRPRHPRLRARPERLQVPGGPRRLPAGRKLPDHAARRRLLARGRRRRRRSNASGFGPAKTPCSRSNACAPGGAPTRAPTRAPTSTCRTCNGGPPSSRPRPRRSPISDAPRSPGRKTTKMISSTGTG